MARAKKSKAVKRLIEGALAAAEAYRSPETFLSGRHVLVVDDQPRDLERTVAMLRRLGGYDLEISTARTFSAAIDICMSHSGAFDVVVLNHWLGPTDNGLELLRYLRHVGLADEAVSVLYSSSMTRELRQQALDAGFSETLHTDDMDTVSLHFALVPHLLPRATATPEKKTPRRPR